jgi:hypothetical protein
MRQRRPVEVADAPVAVDDDYAIGRVLEDHGDLRCGFFGLLLSYCQFLSPTLQFVLVTLQRVCHRIERTRDPADFGFFPNVDAPRMLTEFPLVRGIDQLAKRPIDEAPRAEPRQDQHKRRAQDEKEDAMTRVTLSFGEGLCLLKAEADDKPARLRPQSRVAFDTLRAVDIHDIGCAPLIYLRVCLARHLGTDEPIIKWVSSKIGAIAVCDGDRCSRRHALPGDKVTDSLNDLLLFCGHQLC